MIMPLTWAGIARAGEGNRTLMTSLEGWGSAIELRPQWPRQLSPREAATRVAYRLFAVAWSPQAGSRALGTLPTARVRLIGFGAFAQEHAASGR